MKDKLTKEDISVIEKVAAKIITRIEDDAILHGTGSIGKGNVFEIPKSYTDFLSDLRETTIAVGDAKIKKYGGGNLKDIYGGK